MSYLSTIARLSSADNLGGLLTIQVARKADIVSIPEPVDGVVYGDITFLPGKGFVTWDTTTETASASSSGRQTREGSSRGNKLPFNIPKDRTGLREMFLAAEDDELIVLYNDASGNQRLFGLLDSPVKFRFDHDSGSGHADLNHFACEFYYTGPDNVYSYNGAISTPPAGTAPSIVRVNGVVVATLAPGQIIDFTTPFTFAFTIVGT